MKSLAAITTQPATEAPVKRIYTDHPAAASFYHLTEAAPCNNPVPNSVNSWVPFFLTIGEARQGRVCGLWSTNGANGFDAPPAIGERVEVTMNGFGPGTVVGYFVESGFIGIEVKVDNRPDWHRKQDPTNKHPHPLVFGSEIQRIA